MCIDVAVCSPEIHFAEGAADNQPKTIDEDLAIAQKSVPAGVFGETLAEKMAEDSDGGKGGGAVGALERLRNKQGN